MKPFTLSFLLVIDFNITPVNKDMIDFLNTLSLKLLNK